MEGTRSRRRLFWELLFGILLPLLCLVADPVVFRGWDTFASKYRLLAYLFAGVEMAVLAGWLAARDRLGPSAAYFVGPLAAGAAFAFLVGVCLLPLSILGMLFVIGVLGFTPFATGVVFLKSAIEAFRIARRHSDRRRLALLALGGIVFVGAPCVAVLQFHFGVPLDRFAGEALEGIRPIEIRPIGILPGSD